jgi:hypothetical protein
MFSGQVQTVKTFVLPRASHFFIIFIYLWLLLSVYALHNSIVLSDWRLIGHLAPAMLKAVVFAKFVLIGEHLKLGKRFEDRPLIWPILIKAALFSVVLVGFDCLEAVIVHAIWPHAGARSGDGVELMNIRVISAFSFMSFIALIPFFGIMELSRVLGEDQMRKLFFHKHAKLTLVPSNP